MSIPYAEVIGDPIAHSKSPLIHIFWLKALGIAGDYRKTRVTAEELPAFFAARRGDPDWRGCNVTVPHKQAVIPLLDRIDSHAERLGAVKTVCVENGALVGYNSDHDGFLEPLRDLLDQRQLFRIARVMGAGGAARAVAQALAAHGFVVVIAARDQAKARKLADMLPGGDHHVAPLAGFAEPLDFAWDDREGILDIVVNTTSLGMTGQSPLAIDFSNVPPGAVIYDIVYSPLETPLLAEARARGHRVIDGLSMLIGQAAIAFEHFFGAPAPREQDAELRALLTA